MSLATSLERARPSWVPIGNAIYSPRLVDVFTHLSLPSSKGAGPRPPPLRSMIVFQPAVKRAPPEA